MSILAEYTIKCDGPRDNSCVYDSDVRTGTNPLDYKLGGKPYLNEQLKFLRSRGWRMFKRRGKYTHQCPQCRAQGIRCNIEVPNYVGPGGAGIRSD